MNYDMKLKKVKPYETTLTNFFILSIQIKMYNKDYLMRYLLYCYV